MKTISKQLLALTFTLVSVLTFAQSIITGKIADAKTQEPLAEVEVGVDGTDNFVSTDQNGEFKIDVPAGQGTLVIESYGFGTKEFDYDVANNATKNLGTIQLSSDQTIGEIVYIGTGVIDIAKDRETPVAVSTIRAADIQEKLGNQEFPEILKTTPSIYATKQGGGYGDSRINVRGFNQRNTAVLINGQPVNDMENGRVFWSNWAGLQDVASAVQVQRGLGASKLAVPSVGGTINIVTKATEKKQGGSVIATYGNDNYRKLVGSYNTGVNENGWAASILLGRWAGDGYADATEGEGTTYFFSLGYKPSEKHHLNAIFTGAGQWHNQRDLRLSIRDFQNFGGDDFRKFNGDWGFRNGEVFTFRRNFYNKPVASINWDWNITEDLELSTVLYGSWGRGGGTGPRGRNFGIYPFRKDLTQAVADGDVPFRKTNGTIDFDAVVQNNRNSATPYTGNISNYNGLLIGSHNYNGEGISNNIAVRRASINSHDWYGAISNLKKDINENLTASFGIDLRSYKGYHYRVLNDLLGLDGYYSTGNNNIAGAIYSETVEASPFKNITEAPKINYFNIGYVKWAGLNGLLEYKKDAISAVLQGGTSWQAYQRKDPFSYIGSENTSAERTINGGYIKGGINYNINSQHNVFGNAGLIKRQPNFDAIFQNFGNIVDLDAGNETITSFEIGYGFRSTYFNANLNFYNTLWTDRFIRRGFTINGVDGTANFSDIEQLHQGVEIDFTAKPLTRLDVFGQISLGNWIYKDAVQSEVFDDNQNSLGTKTLYLKDVKVGDAAQTTASLGAKYEIFNGFKVDATWNYANDLYANFNPEDSAFDTVENQGGLKLPAYHLFDAGASYKYKFDNDKKSLTLRANINNLFDTEYISEASSNIHANESSVLYKGIDNTNTVWFGFGRTWNVSARLNF